MLSGQWEEGKSMTFPFSICCKLLGNTSYCKDQTRSLDRRMDLFYRV